MVSESDARGIAKFPGLIQRFTNTFVVVYAGAVGLGKVWHHHEFLAYRIGVVNRLLPTIALCLVQAVMSACHFHTKSLHEVAKLFESHPKYFPIEIGEGFNLLVSEASHFFKYTFWITPDCIP